MSDIEQTTETVETPTAPASTEGGGETPEHGTETVESTPAAYTPNFKFKVYDEEKEIPESFRALVKDSATEKEVRELFEKAHGLDGLKPVHQKAVKERDEYLNQYKETKSQFDATMENLRKIHAYSQSDLDTFFQVYKIPQEKLFQYVTEKLKESELPPEQVERMQAGRQAKLEAEYYKEQVARQEKQNQDLFKQQHDFHMNQVMSQPDVAGFAKDFDSRAGKQGEFLQKVYEYGDRIFRTENRYAPPQEAVNAVLGYYKSLLNYNPSQQATGQGTVPGSEAPPPPIPNLGSGRSVSPTKPKFKTLDQLRKHVKDITTEA